MFFLVASVACVALSSPVLADDREDCSSIDVVSNNPRL